MVQSGEEAVLHGSSFFFIVVIDIPLKFLFQRSATPISSPVYNAGNGGEYNLSFRWVGERITGNPHTYKEVDADLAGF